MSQVAVTPEEVKAQYASAEKTYRQDEQRQVLLFRELNGFDDRFFVRRIDEVARRAANTERR